MNNKLVFLGIIFIALISFAVFSDDSEEVDNGDVLQQEENVLSTAKDRKSRPKKNGKDKRNFVFDENDGKRKVYKKIIFIEAVFIFVLFSILIILKLFFNFCEKKMDEDKKETTEKILYLLEQEPKKGEEQHKDNLNPDNIADADAEAEAKLQEEERQKKAAEEQKKLTELQFKANVSLTIKVSGDKIVIFHYDKDSNEDFEDYKKNEAEKNQEIVEFLKRSFTTEKNYCEVMKQNCGNDNDLNALNFLTAFIESFMAEQDLDVFLNTVVSEIRRTLKILTLEGYDEIGDQNKIGFIKDKAPVTYNFLGRFKPEELQGDPNNINNNPDNLDANDVINNNNINNNNNNINVVNKKKKQLIFNCFEYGDEGVINKDSDIKADAFNKYSEDQKVITGANNQDVWYLIANYSYKEYIKKGLEKLGTDNNLFNLLSDSELCPFKTLLTILNITRSIVNEISSINDFCAIKNAADEVKNFSSNAYQNFFL